MIGWKMAEKYTKNGRRKYENLHTTGDVIWKNYEFLGTQRVEWAAIVDMARPKVQDKQLTQE